MKLYWSDTRVGGVAVHWQIDCPLDGFKFVWCKKISRNRGLWLVESSESWLLIGREDSLKIYKGGTLTIYKLCHWMVFDLFFIMKLNWSGIRLVELTQEWLEWKSIDKLAVHWHDWNWILSQWQRIGPSDTPVVQWHWAGLWQQGQIHLNGPVFSRFPL